MGKQNYELRAMVDGKYQVKEIAASSEKDAESIFLDTLKAMGWENKECQILAVKEIVKTEEKDLEEAFEKLHKTAYEKYQLKWMISQGYSLSDVVGVMAACAGESAFEHEIAEEEDAKTLVRDAYDGFLENGFAGSCIFVCMDEFLDAEYHDPEYMKFLLTEEEFELWCREMDFTPDNVIASVDTPTGELIVRTSGVYDDYPGVSIEVNDGDDCSPAGCVFEYDEVKKDLQCVVYRKDSDEPAEVVPLNIFKPYQLQTVRGLVCIKAEFASEQAAEDAGYSYAFISDGVKLYSKCMDTEGHRHVFAKIVS